MGAVSVFTLLRGIIFKERIKLRLTGALLLVVNIVCCVWGALQVQAMFRMDHAEIVWYKVFGLQYILFESIRHVPCLTGLLLACIQFLPEMRDERLRLALHLPVQSNIVILAHMLMGILALACIALIDLAVMSIAVSAYFPREAVVTQFLTWSPWFLAGFVMYLGIMQALLEPGLILRMSIIVLTFALVFPMLAHQTPGVSSKTMLVFSAIPVLLVFSALLPGYHFRQRREA